MRAASAFTASCLENILELCVEKYKLPSNDEIPEELIQAGDDNIKSEIHALINYVWNKEELFGQWKNLFLYEFSKGDRSGCSNCKCKM
jgi:hypothetical protein